MRMALISIVSVTALAAACAAVAGNAVSTAGTQTESSRQAAMPAHAADSYYIAAAAEIDGRIAARGIEPARNVILFIGDGMGVSTITAARIYAGQSLGLDGESHRLTMDGLPYSALSRTYTHTFQVADSAATATAMVTGAKTPGLTLGVSQDAVFSNCASEAGNQLETLFEIAARAGLGTGVVTTTRLTHATPAAAWAKSVNRNWEADTDMRGAQDSGCRDIARQFIEWEDGRSFDIALAGGRAQFLPADHPDPEYSDQTGVRGDGRNLIEEWTAKSERHEFIFDQAGFDAIDFASDKKVLGLFEPSHMQYELDRADDKAGEPSLAEMTRAAITHLSQNDDGYVLMVEGGRIDHAHHGTNAIRALEDTLAFDEAIAEALAMTDPSETLIVVTADHSHVFTMAGYPARGNPILGLVSTSGMFGQGVALGLDGKPYTTLGYANGPSACRPAENGELDCSRQDLTDVDTKAADFRQPALVPLYSETHGGEDVVILASGPGAHIFSGIMEQNEIFHVMGRASGLVAAPSED